MNKVRSIIIFQSAAILLVAASVFYVRAGNAQNISQVILCDLVILLAAGILSMITALRISLKETLYSYLNIGLVGGILFATVLILIVGGYALRHMGVEFTLEQVYAALLDFPRSFSYYALFVIVAVCVLVGISNIALIRHEGFCLNNALSLLVAGFYIGGTQLVYCISDIFGRNTGEDTTLAVIGTAVTLFLVLMLCYFECILAGSAVMGWKAARHIPAYDKDYIIILGCSIDKRGGLLPLLKGRVNRAIRFAWDQEIATGKPLKYVPSGGQGENEIMSEGSAMELYLLTRGAESYEVFPEKKSKSTWENMCFSKEIIDRLKPDAKIAFATTNYHMLRSGILARKAGIDAEGIAGDTKWYFWPNGFVREFFAILALNVRAHIITASAAAVLCAVICTAGIMIGII